jgi:hypothetical protein
MILKDGNKTVSVIIINNKYSIKNGFKNWLLYNLSLTPASNTYSNRTLYLCFERSSSLRVSRSIFKLYFRLMGMIQFLKDGNKTVSVSFQFANIRIISYIIVYVA